jgi:hypothetical protein
MNRREKLALSTTTIFFGLLCGGAAFAAGVNVIDASKAELNDAKGPYLDGVKAMNSKHYKEAVEKFQESYNIVASPNSRLMLGRALIKVNRPLDAYKELEETVAQATELAGRQPKYQKTADAARKELDDVKVELAFITVIPGTEVSIGGRKLSDVDWGKPMPVSPGRVLVEITATDGRIRKKRLRLEPGVTRVLTADLTATSSYSARSPSEEEAPKEQEHHEEAGAASSGPASGLDRRTVGYISGAVGVVGIGAFVGFNVAASATFGDPKEKCKGTPLVCSAAAVDNGEAKGRYEGFGLAALGVGLAGLGLGAYLVFTDHSSSAATTESAEPAAPTTSLRLGPGSFALQRTF